jgi:hypothetical protein
MGDLAVDRWWCGTVRAERLRRTPLRDRFVPEPDAHLDRLRPSERATLDRARRWHPERDLRVAREEHVDGAGRTYDQMGNPDTSRFWGARAAQKFYRSVDAHLRKSTDFTLIDLTGFSARSRGDIAAYVDSLPADQQAKIVRLGF